MLAHKFFRMIFQCTSKKLIKCYLMLQKLNLENLLFLDIETVPETAQFSELSEEKQLLWEQKSKYQRKEEKEKGRCLSLQQYQ